MSPTFYVAKLLADGSESRVGQMDYTVLASAIRKAGVEARKWRKVLKGVPRKLEQVPTHVLVREQREGTAVNFAQHVIEVRRPTPEEAGR